MRSASSAGREPRNTRVRCSRSAGTGRSAVLASAAAAPHPASASRTPSGRSAAAKSRIYRATGRALALAEQQPADHVHARPSSSGRGRPCARPAACTVRVMRRPSRAAAEQAHGADRLLRRPAARARDPGDADADVRAEPPQRADRERLGDLGRHRAERSMSSGSTPTTRIFASFAYTTAPPST